MSKIPDELFCARNIQGFECTSASSPFSLTIVLCNELRAFKPRVIQPKPFYLITTAKGYVAVRGDGVAVFRELPNPNAPWLDSEKLIPYAILREQGIGVVAEKLCELEPALPNAA